MIHIFVQIFWCLVDHSLWFALEGWIRSAELAALYCNTCLAWRGYSYAGLCPNVYFPEKVNPRLIFTSDSRKYLKGGSQFLWNRQVDWWSCAVIFWR